MDCASTSVETALDTAGWTAQWYRTSPIGLLSGVMASHQELINHFLEAASQLTTTVSGGEVAAPAVLSVVTRKRLPSAVTSYWNTSLSVEIMCDSNSGIGVPTSR